MGNLDEVAEYFGEAKAKPLSVYKKKGEAKRVIDDRLRGIPGELGHAVDYFNSSAINPQPMFAVQTALAIGSVVCSRIFRGFINGRYSFTSLYFLNIAKSACGKENCISTIENVLSEVGMDDLIAPSGFHSGSAVFSSLASKPRGIAAIDEFGRHLEAGRKSGNSNLEAANTMLMEIIGRCGGTVRDKGRATQSMTSAEKDKMIDKITHPALSMMCLTTPSTFYENMTFEQIKDGFLGRFICWRSDEPRQRRRDMEEPLLSDGMIVWADQLRNRYIASCGNLGEIAECPSQITLKATSEASDLLYDFEIECVNKMDELDSHGVPSELIGRTAEFASRIAVIVQLSIDAGSSKVGKVAAQWAVDYMRMIGERTVDDVKKQIHGSSYEKNKVEILNAVRNLADRGVTTSEMQRKKPFSHFKQQELNTIINALIGSGLVAYAEVNKGHAGRPRMAFYATNGDNVE